MANNCNYSVDSKLRELENLIAQQNIDLINKDLSAQNTINILNHQLAFYQQQLQQQHQQINFIAGENGHMDAELTNVYCTLVKRDRDVKALINELETLTSKWNQAESELQGKTKRIENLEFEKGVLRSYAFRLNDLHKQLSDKNKKIKRKDNEMKILSTEYENKMFLAEERIAELEDSLEKMNDEKSCVVEEKQPAAVDKAKSDEQSKITDNNGGNKDFIFIASVTDSDYDTGLTTDESRQGSLSNLMLKCEKSVQSHHSENPGLVACRVENAMKAERAGDEVLLNPLVNPIQDVPRIVTQNKQVAKPKRRYISLAKIACY